MSLVVSSKQFNVGAHVKYIDDSGIHPGVGVVEDILITDHYNPSRSQYLVSWLSEDLEDLGAIASDKYSGDQLVFAHLV